jgi:transposase-like protein
MSQDILLESLGQVSGGEAAQIFRDFLRGGVRMLLSEVMAEEVAQLCGPKHHPNGSELVRAGSSSGRVLLDRQHETITRPRVRKKEPNGSTTEFPLQTYEAACNPEELQKAIVTALTAGVSTRELKNLHPKANGTSRSNLSRLWQEAGQKFVDKLRTPSLAEQDWVVLMLDGIRLCKDQFAIVAIGITDDGRKHVLDFSLGSSENTENCRELLRRILARLRLRTSIACGFRWKPRPAIGYAGIFPCECDPTLLGSQGA